MSICPGSRCASLIHFFCPGAVGCAAPDPQQGLGWVQCHPGAPCFGAGSVSVPLIQSIWKAALHLPGSASR